MQPLPTSNRKVYDVSEVYDVCDVYEVYEVYDVLAAERTYFCCILANGSLFSFS